MKQIIHKLALLVIFLVGIVNTIGATDSAPVSEIHKKYAVIINGGGNNSDFHRYWNDCSVVYQTLLNNGYYSYRTYLAIAEGNIDLDNPSNNISGSTDLDGDGDDDDIIYPATLDYLQDIFFTWLPNRMTSDDDLFIYVTGSGKRNATTGHSYIILSGEDSISDVAFTHMLEALQYRTINIVMQQDYAGGFIDDVITLDNVVITTACHTTEKAHPMASDCLDEFTFRWISAITGDSPYNMIDCDACRNVSPIQSSPSLPDCFVTDDGDANWDGYVTMKEAFNYAEHYNHSPESPQMESNPGCLSRALALNELLYSDDCSAALIDGWDLYMRDNSEDDGLEPNLSTNEHWLTPDIWFERNGQKVDKLRSGQTYDICVRVFNRGAETSPGGEELYAHWTRSRIGGSWPWGWTGYSYDCNGTPVRQGDLAGSIVLPPIEGGKTYTARISWTTPDSEEYDPCFESLGTERNELWHYSVLARIVDSQEQPDETITGMEFPDFVLEFNNVASCNVTILKALNNYPSIISTGIVGLANPRYQEECGPYTLKFDIDRVDDLDHFANVTLTFPSWFYNSHYDMTYQNCYNQGYGHFAIHDSARFDNINFTADDNYFYPLVLDVEYIEFNPNLFYDYEINLTLEDASGVLVGGEKFKFWNDPNDMANSIRARDIPKEEGIVKDQEPIIPDEILYVDVYNAQGQLLMRSSSDNIESLNLSQGVYILRKVGETQYYSIKIIK